VKSSSEGILEHYDDAAKNVMPGSGPVDAQVVARGVRAGGVQTPPDRRSEEKFEMKFNTTKFMATAAVRRVLRRLRLIGDLPIARYPGASNRRRFVDAVW
jgi:hypothetical protein